MIIRLLFSKFVQQDFSNDVTLHLKLKFFRDAFNNVFLNVLSLNIYNPSLLTKIRNNIHNEIVSYYSIFIVREYF